MSQIPDTLLYTYLRGKKHNKKQLRQAERNTQAVVHAYVYIEV